MQAWGCSWEGPPLHVSKTQGHVWGSAVTFQDSEAESQEISKGLTDPFNSSSTRPEPVAAPNVLNSGPACGDPDSED